ncbi:MAG: class I SAM-dependent methyltransferase [Acidithiobacillus sp.]|uniref:class I SAM-dependent methyltransferase n=1 Tax=Acidithiobacillus sp. TaxID=1872118 RepID=UPI003D077973
MNTVTATPARRSTRLPASARLLFNLLERLPEGQLTVRGPAGEIWTFRGQAAGLEAEWQIHDWAAVAATLRDGDIGFGRSYRDGDWDSPDLTALIRLALRNRHLLEDCIQGHWARRGLYWLADQLLRRNSRKGSRRNIAQHYDLGNDFYGLWLDPSMTYSSAYYGNDREQSLEDAQRAKYQAVLDALQLRPGAEILEIGCGWGGFAELAARQGYRVRGLTLSREQREYAEQRIARLGLDGLASFHYQDYRDEAGRYDGIVSIEMFEAVGREWWSTYFGQVHQLLQPGGRAVIQTISIRDERFERYASGSDFIRRYVFPGGLLPSPTRFSQSLAAAGLQVLGRLDFGLDYALTLKHWRESFDRETKALTALGFDTAFRRLWRFYLSYCEAGFAEKELDVGQWTLSHA